MFGNKITGGYILLLLTISSMLAASCKKNREDYGMPAVVQLLNAMDDDMQLVVNYSGNHPIRYDRALELGNKYYSHFNTITLHQLPQSLALYYKEDTLEKDPPLVNAPLDLEPSASYSLIAFGSKSAPDYLLHKDEHTVGNIRDSLAFIRIINLVKGQKFSVNLKDEPIGSIEQEIGYRSVSVFKGYDAKRSVTEHIFEFRDQATGNLLLSYPVIEINGNNAIKNTWLNRTNTLVLTGHVNGTGTNALRIVLIPHFF